MVIEGYVLKVGLPDHRRDVILSIDETYSKSSCVKFFTHWDDGCYVWMTPEEAEDLGMRLLALARTVRERKMESVD